MKIVFVSNYYNHHQASFSNAMRGISDVQYRFIATQEMEEERKKMGWENDALPDFVLPMYKCKETRSAAQRLINDADAVIFGLPGWRNFRLIQSRLKAAKLTFRYTERIYKKGIHRYEIPMQRIKQRFVGGKCPSMHLLCASAYTAQDYAKTGCYLGRSYKWGYFPETKEYAIDELIGKKTSAAESFISILWAGRLISWKHPEFAIGVAEKLLDKGYAFKMSIIGNGEMEDSLRKEIVEKKLENCVELLGAMTPDEVRTHMEKTDIYLFTSDFNEGWGAVLNEAMNSGCAVVASHAVGSAPFLIQSGENGLIYESGNKTELETQVERLIQNDALRRSMGRNAYFTIHSLWNGEIAAQRLYELAKSMKNGTTVQLPENGPCSRAEVLQNDWYGKTCDAVEEMR